MKKSVLSLSNSNSNFETKYANSSNFEKESKSTIDSTINNSNIVSLNTNSTIDGMTKLDSETSSQIQVNSSLLHQTKNTSEDSSERKAVFTEPEKAVLLSKNETSNYENIEKNEKIEKSKEQKYITNPYGVEDYFNYYFNREYNPKNNDNIHVNNQNMRLSTYIIFKFLDEKYNSLQSISTMHSQTPSLSSSVLNSSHLNNVSSLNNVNNLSLLSGSSKYQSNNSYSLNQINQNNYTFSQKYINNGSNLGNISNIGHNINNITSNSFNNSINTNNINYNQGNNYLNSLTSTFPNNHSFNPHYSNPLVNQLGLGLGQNMSLNQVQGLTLPSHSTNSLNNITQNNNIGYLNKQQLGTNLPINSSLQNSTNTFSGSITNPSFSNSKNTNFNNNNLSNLNSNTYGNYYKKGSLPDKTS